MQNLLFDTPWWLLLLLPLAGAALWWSGNNRRDKTLMRVGIGVALLGVALGIVSWSVDTDVEKVTRQTRQIVQAVDQKDWNRLRSLLDQRTTFARYGNRDAIISGAQATADSIGLKSVRVFRLEAQQKDTLIQVNFNVISDQDRTGGQNLLTNWQFDWQNFGTGWRLDRITPTGGQNVNAEQIKAHLQPGK